MKAKNVSSISIMSKRKTEHIEISLEKDVSFRDLTAGFEKYRFIHQALPEMDLDQVDTGVSLYGKHLSVPLLISSMVGGVDEATVINRNLAEAAQSLGLAMGVGSQRCAIEDPSAVPSFQVRDVAPDILLFANVGAVQLNYGFGPDQCRRAVDMIEADALFLHLNPLQEAIQHEGNTRFDGLLKKIESLCRSLSVPVIAKEVCFGISETAARQLADAGVSGIDVAGAGGTSWSQVEKYRSLSKSAYDVADTFASWGIPTADSVVMAKRGAPDLPVIASGGIRTGIDAAKAVALGASAAGIALPLLKAACESPEAVQGALREIIETFRIAMFCSGVRNIAALQKTELIKTM
ncbi:MAG TPA: type 2 isopentenyl-diphosphate Delta-isomerase [Spirochaetota bacterium]|nr:type 2 isopentenyl-diphosphate Delta-isomerase [Spirochaetota bacterium]HPC39913.1 type 2 isopentenyl-diphosphate Delta-isomerase [Spirochaetota bacterium]HPL18832.1 type 2 isopentenyl-diphosphate Delta-isomerase [Spirochaetota bacterium]HQF08911.1 type 2 isopentenyl-diphosphate Delta-isomerase [Spirochaetota bacterium]HQH97837.1 type 2 isopentenyl-diphosphate Delta-isomerase [Spirochaetota bacterium]